MQALTASSPPTVFLLPAAHFLLDDARWPPGGLQIVSSSVTLVGTDPTAAILDAQRGGRFFDVRAGNLTLRNLVLVNGLATSTGGGVVSAQTRSSHSFICVQMQVCNLVNSSAEAAGKVQGGAIFAAASSSSSRIDLQLL
eukprot:1202329-Prymnesium_polylepis.1